MSTNVNPIPKRYRAAIPMLAVHDGAGAIEFYKKAFAATEVMRLVDKEGKIAHAEIKIGDAQVMLADEHPVDSVSPRQLGKTTVLIHLFVEDVDALFEKAVAAGGKVVRPLANEFIGTRNGKLQDPYGHVWLIQTQKEEVSDEEIERRFAAMTT
jgi:PhnB protein